MGYTGLLMDLDIKIAGKSRAKLTPESPLSDLVCCYGNPKTATDYVVNFLRHVYPDANLSERTPLSFFTEA